MFGDRLERLDTIAPWLGRILRNSSERSLRGAALVASQYAAGQVDMNDPLISDAIQCIREGGNDQTMRAELLALSAQLDDEYFAREEDAKAGLIDEQDYLNAFVQARAVAAVAAALDTDPTRAAFESVYEAAVLVDNPDELLEAVRQALE